MDAIDGAQYAVFVAMQTLKTRCNVLQQRVLTLEEENVNLRLQGLKSADIGQATSLSEQDKLKAQVAELSEQKEHLLQKMKMIKTENEEVWSKLKQLSHQNEDLGAKLGKLTNSINQYASKKAHHSPLIRSKTFTQDEPQSQVLQKKKEEDALNGKTTSELEEISLKIIAQTRNELDSLCSDLNESQCIDNLISDSCGFYYDDFDENTFEEVKALLEELRMTKSLVQNQKTALEVALNQVNKLQETKSKTACDNKVPTKEMVDKSIETESKDEIPVAQHTSTETGAEELEIYEKYCPMCSKVFDCTVKFEEFTDHVESHFREDSYELL